MTIFSDSRLRQKFSDLVLQQVVLGGDINLCYFSEALMQINSFDGLTHKVNTSLIIFGLGTSHIISIVIK
jgi:hypothetical protein